MNQPEFWNGFRVIEDIGQVTPIRVRRSWRERLFSLPFRPFEATKEKWIPNPDAYISEREQIIIVHPITAQRLRAALKAGHP